MPRKASYPLRAECRETAPANVQPGDKLVISGIGITEVERVEFVGESHVCYHLARQQPVTLHTSNWPFVFTGNWVRRADNYIAADGHRF